MPGGLAPGDPARNGIAQLVPSFQQHLDTLERWRRLPGLERLAGGRGRVGLTFDDGPDPDATPAVLDALERTRTRATFFMVGEQVVEHPELAGRVRAGGHEVGLHGFRHLPHDRLGREEAHADIARGLQAVEAATGARPRRYRPPYGRFTDGSYHACRGLGLQPVYWSAWGSDWEDIDAERIAELVTRDLVDGLIVLLHDSARYAHRRSAAATAGALGPIAAAAADRGLTLDSLGV